MESKVNRNIDDIIEGLAAAYEQNPLSRNGYRCPLPNKAAVTDITNQIRNLLFPGYFTENTPDDATIRYYIADIILGVNERLYGQVLLALSQAGAGRRDMPCRDAELTAKAEDICYEFFKALPEIRDIVVTDVQAAFDGDPAAKDKELVITSYPGVVAISIYRIAHKLHELGVPYIPRMMTEYAHSRTGIDIHPGARIGRYFFIDHGTGVVIGETAVIGDNVKIYQGVTLGALSTRGGQSLNGKRRHPTIEDNVTLYSGATVLGGQTVIERDCTIGGNVFLTDRVPAGTTVLNKPPELEYRQR